MIARNLFEEPHTPRKTGSGFSSRLIRDRRPVIGALCIPILLLASCSPAPNALPTPPSGLTFIPRATLPVALPTPVADSATATLPAAEEGISVWFTNPVSREVNPGEAVLVQAVNGAKQSVDMAIYNLTLDGLGNALIQAHRRGVVVRIAMESEAMDKQLPQKLQAEGIPIVGDQREGLMHDKFTVIDGAEVWTGSANYASASFTTDFNNLVRIRSRQMAQDYQAEFEQMFAGHQFGPDKKPVAPYHQVSVAGIPVEVYFSPADGVEQHVLDALRQAQASIDFLGYSFTSNPISQTMRDRARAGVKVRGVFDRSQSASNTGGEYQTLKRAGLDVRLSDIQGLMHDKVIIIDGQVVITGSYNFTASAEDRNDENLVILRSAALAKQFLAHFDDVYASSK